MKSFSTFTVTTSLLVAIACSACHAESQDPSPQASQASTPAPAAPRGEGAPSAPVTREEVIEPRGSGPFDPASYVAHEGNFRIMGVELGDGTLPRTVLLADTKDWTTRAYREGDLIGRSYLIASIDARSVALQPARGEALRLQTGQDVHLRVVEHQLDVVARPLGKNRFELDPAAARAAHDENPALPSVQALDLFGGHVLRLGVVREGSLFDKADFQEGDLVAAVDGASATEGSLDAIVRGLTDGRSALTVRIYRRGVPVDRVFSPRAR